MCEEVSDAWGVEMHLFHPDAGTPDGRRTKCGMSSYPLMHAQTLKHPQLRHAVCPVCSLKFSHTLPHFPHPPLHNAVCLVNCDEADACAAVQRLQLRQAVDCQLGGDVDEQVLQVWPGVGKCK